MIQTYPADIHFCNVNNGNRNFVKSLQGWKISQNNVNDVVLVPLLLNSWKYFRYCSVVSIVDFEQVNASWADTAFRKFLENRPQFIVILICQSSFTVFHVDEKHKISRQYLLHLLMPDHPNEGRYIIFIYHYFIVYMGLSIQEWTK